MSDSDKNKSVDQEPKESAQQALSNYLDDMLGGVGASPLDNPSASSISTTDTVQTPLEDAQDSASEAPRELKEPPTELDQDRSPDKPSTKEIPQPVPPAQTKRKAVEKPALPKATHAEISIPKLAPPKLAPAPLVKAKVQPVVQTSTKTETKSEGKVSDKERAAIKEMLRQQRATKEARLQAALKARNMTVGDAIAQRNSPKVATVEQQQQAAAEVPAPQSDTERQSSSGKTPLKQKHGRPEWAQDRFECLLFTVAGLKLAVPLVSLGSIHQLDGELTPLVGRAEWFLGLFRYGDRNIRVVDTAQWVMPKLHNDSVIDGYQFVIRLGEGNWGVACDAVHEAIQLTPDQVKWRTQQSKRAWLSGTVIDHMCALLDADALASMLDFEVAQRVR